MQDENKKTIRGMYTEAMEKIDAIVLEHKNKMREFIKQAEQKRVEKLKEKLQKIK